MKPESEIWPILSWEPVLKQKENIQKENKECFQRWNRCERFKVVRLSSSIPWDLRHAEQLNIDDRAGSQEIIGILQVSVFGQKGGQKSIPYKQLGLSMDIETKVVQHVSSPKESNLTTLNLTHLFHL